MTLFMTLYTRLAKAWRYADIKKTVSAHAWPDRRTEPPVAWYAW
jgi:hypothetical protein